MKKRVIMFFVVLTLLIATTCMLTACGGSDLKKGNSIVDITDVEVNTDADGDITSTKYQDKKIEVSYLVGDNTYIQLTGNKASKMKISGYSGAVTSLSLKDIEKSIKVDGENINVDGIKPGAFAGCETLTTVDLKKQNEALNFKISDLAFASCANLTSVVLPDKIFSNENFIGKGAFSNCTSLTSITGMEKFPLLDEAVFNACTSLEGIDLSSKTTYIPTKLFFNCEKLANITLPLTVKIIQDEAFVNTAVANIDFSQMTELLGIGDDAFKKTKLTAINLPDSIVYIGNGAFVENKLTSVNIPFLGNNFIQTVSWRFVDTYGAMYDTPKPDPDNFGEFIYPDYAKTEVTVRSANKLDKINFSNSTVTKLTINFAPIGEKILYGIDDINRDVGNGIYANDIVKYVDNKIDIEELPNNIPANFLFDARQLESINIPNITKIGKNAFNGAVALKDISGILNDKTESIGDNAFAGSGVESVVLPENIQEIGTGLFTGCENLTSLTINKFYNDASIINNIFKTMAPKNLATINLGEKITAIPNGAFTGLMGLTALNTAADIESIGAYAFDGCKALPGYNDAVTVLNNWVVKVDGVASNIVLPTSVVGLANNTITSAHNIYYSGTEDQFKAIKNTTGITYPGDITLYADGEIVEDNGIIYYLDGSKNLCVLAVNSNDKIITIKDKLTIGETEYNVTKLMNGAFFHVNNDILFLPATVTATESHPFGMNTINTIEFAGTESQYSALAAGGNFSMISNHVCDVAPTDSYTYIVKENGVEIFRTTSLYIDYKYEKLGYKLISTKVGDDDITFPYKATGHALGEEVVIDLETAQLELPEFEEVEKLVINNSFTYTFVKADEKYCANNLGRGNTTARIELIANTYVKFNINFSVISETGYDNITMKLVDSYGVEKNYGDEITGSENKSYTIELDPREKLIIKYSKDGSGNANNEKAEFSYVIIK